MRRGRVGMASGEVGVGLDGTVELWLEGCCCEGEDDETLDPVDIVGEPDRS